MKFSFPSFAAVVFIILPAFAAGQVQAAKNCTLSLQNNSDASDEAVTQILNKVFSRYLDKNVVLLTADASKQKDNKGCRLFGSFVSNSELKQLLVNKDGRQYFTSSSGQADLEELVASLAFQMADDKEKNSLCQAYSGLKECKEAKLPVASPENSGTAEDALPDSASWQFHVLFASSSYVYKNGETGADSIADNAGIMEGENKDLGYGTGAELGITRKFGSVFGVGGLARFAKDNKEREIPRTLPVEDESAKDKDIKIRQDVFTEMLLATLSAEAMLKYGFTANAALAFGYARSYSKYRIEHDPAGEYDNIRSLSAANWVYGLNLMLDTGKDKGVALRLLYSYLFSSKSHWQYSSGGETKNGEVFDAALRTIGIGFRIGI